MIRVGSEGHTVTNVLGMIQPGLITPASCKVTSLVLEGIDLMDDLPTEVYQAIDFSSIQTLSLMECLEFPGLFQHLIANAANLKITSFSLDNFDTEAEMGKIDPASLPAFLACFSGLKKLHIAVSMPDWALDFNTALSQHSNTIRDLVLCLGEKRNMSSGMLRKINKLCPYLESLAVRSRKNFGLLRSSYRNGVFVETDAGFR